MCCALDNFPAAALADGTIRSRHLARICGLSSERKQTTACAKRDALWNFAGGGGPVILSVLSLLDANRVAGDGADDRMPNLALVVKSKVVRNFVAHEFDERFHLGLHLAHLVAHVEDDFDAR